VPPGKGWMDTILIPSLSLWCVFAGFDSCRFVVAGRRCRRPMTSTTGGKGKEKMPNVGHAGEGGGHQAAHPPFPMNHLLEVFPLLIRHI